MSSLIAPPDGACPNWCNGNHQGVARVTHRMVVGRVAGGIVEVHQEELGNCGRRSRQPYVSVQVNGAHMDRLDRERSLELAGLLDACGRPSLAELLRKAVALIDGEAR